MEFRIFVRNGWLVVFLVMGFFLWSDLACGGPYEDVLNWGGDSRTDVPEPNVMSLKY